MVNRYRDNEIDLIFQVSLGKAADENTRERISDYEVILIFKRVDSFPQRSFEYRCASGIFENVFARSALTAQRRLALYPALPAHTRSQRNYILDACLAEIVRIYRAAHEAVGWVDQIEQA